MTLEELKAALDAAEAAAKAAPEDAALKTAHEQALKAYNDAVAAQGSDSLDESKLDDKTKAYLAKLRKENASHRTKNKELISKFNTSEEQKKAILKAAGIETDEVSPEEKIKGLQAESQTLAFRAGILEAAVAYGVSKDEVEFFEFLVAKEAAALGEGDELDEEKLAAIAAKAKKGATGKGAANTSVGNGQGAGSPAPQSTGTVTLQKFIGMSLSEKSKLYETNPSLYAELMTEARKQKKLV